MGRSAPHLTSVARDKTDMSEYRITARLYLPSHVASEFFGQRLAAVAQGLQRFAPDVSGTPDWYEISVRVQAASSSEAEELWWREVEPILESKRLGSDVAVYSQLPRVMPIQIVGSSADSPFPSRRRLF
jgi:hypothetical protein